MIKFHTISAHITIILSTYVDSVWLASSLAHYNQRWLVCLTKRFSVCLSVDQLVGRAYFAFFVYFCISTPVHRLSVSLHLSSEMYISWSVALRDPRLLHVWLEQSRQIKIISVIGRPDCSDFFGKASQACSPHFDRARRENYLPNFKIISA